MFYIGFFILKSEQFAHSLSFGKRCEQIAQVAHQKWEMWANPESLRSLTKNEQFAQVAHQIWATMSDSLRSLTKNELMSELFVFLSESLIRSFFRKKRVIRSENRWANSQAWIFVRQSSSNMINTVSYWQLA